MGQFGPLGAASRTSTHWNGHCSVQARGRAPHVWTLPCALAQTEDSDENENTDHESGLPGGERCRRDGICPGAVEGSDTLDLVTRTSSPLPGRDRQHRVRRRRIGRAARRPWSGTGPTQHVAPMSRQLNGAQCTANSRQLLIGLDGITVVAKNATRRRSRAPAPTTSAARQPARARRVPVAVHPLHGGHGRARRCGTTCDTAASTASSAARSPAAPPLQGCSPDGTYTFDNGNANARGRLEGRPAPDLRRPEPHGRRDADHRRDRGERGRHGDLLRERRRRCA